MFSVDTPNLLRRNLVVTVRALRLERFEDALQVRLALGRHPGSLAPSPIVRHDSARAKKLLRLNIGTPLSKGGPLRILVSDEL